MRDPRNEKVEFFVTVKIPAVFLPIQISLCSYATKLNPASIHFQFEFDFVWLDSLASKLQLSSHTQGGRATKTL